MGAASDQAVVDLARASNELIAGLTRKLVLTKIILTIWVVVAIISGFTSPPGVVSIVLVCAGGVAIALELWDYRQIRQIRSNPLPDPGPDRPA